MEVIGEGFVGRAGPEISVRKYGEAINVAISPSADFDQAAKNALRLAEELTHGFPQDPNITNAITQGVVALSKSGIEKVAKVGEEILEVIHVPSMDMAVAPR